ncbi:hypothetical protein [Arcticibacterium luteifluviistationis]|uniref:DUF4625 domain-containing protein n=1 Tax=Arcticibacterium luteifluviistationis TaxID=1784714 RepID=A0A2Z4GGP5_9BACT|nr:hypothetical protein [Arcticibacterium luteifluviistationis]AWW00195.1 hypothetical protein DJ013_19270 [Arcticibacterium luteifluviistationis]
MFSKLSSLAFFSLIVLSCNSDIKNESIGLFVTASGLNPTAVNVYSNQSLKADKEIAFGSELTVEILGVDNFKKDKNGQVFIGGENSLIDKDDNVIYFVEDYFKKYDLTGVSAADAEKLKFNIRVGKPMKPGETYRFLFKLWDKKSDKLLKGNVLLNVI